MIAQDSHGSGCPPKSKFMALVSGGVAGILEIGGKWITHAKILRTGSHTHQLNHMRIQLCTKSSNFDFVQCFSSSRTLYESLESSFVEVIATFVDNRAPKLK